MRGVIGRFIWKSNASPAVSDSAFLTILSSSRSYRFARHHQSAIRPTAFPIMKSPRYLYLTASFGFLTTGLLHADLVLETETAELGVKGDTLISAAL